MKHTFYLSAVAISVLLSGCSYIQGSSIAKDNTDTTITNEGNKDAPSPVWVPLESLDSPNIGSDYTYISGKPYSVNKSGEVLIPKSDIGIIKYGNAQVYTPTPIAGIDLSGRELKTLMADKDALFVYLKNPTLQNTGKVSFPILRGSLQDNITRLVGKSNIDSVVFDTSYDFFVPEDQIISASSFDELLNVIFNGYPLEASIEDTKVGKTLRVYDAGNENLHFGFTVKKGSLRDNIFRLAKIAGIKPIWDFNYDYMVEKTQHIRGKSYADLMMKLTNLKDYPLKATVTETKN
ncbi:hypothetical protein V6259_12495 [Marinomonas sp. TI.3.20]|uniref:hypothetical protein n=1 Tax=Marinomonas sp. TI.3.20 TaxID=3121296 RepID=UPI00311F418C